LSVTIKVVSKKSTDKPPALTAEDPIIVVFVEGQYFVFSVAQGLRHIAIKGDKHKDEKRTDPWMHLLPLMDHPRDLLAHFIDAMDTVKISEKRTPLVEREGRIARVQRRPVEKAIDTMIVRAAEVLGSRDEGMRWLGNPVRGLDFATPISLLGTPEGVERVNDILGQIEHGVW